jgi:hypothetical protein
LVGVSFSVAILVFNFDESESEIERSLMPNVCRFSNQLDRVSGNQNQHTRDKMIWGWDVTRDIPSPSKSQKSKKQTCLNVFALPLQA